MLIEIENQVNVYFEDGYQGKIEIKNNPDAPELYTLINFLEDGKQVAYTSLHNEVLLKFIEALQQYKTNLPKEK